MHHTRLQVTCDPGFAEILMAELAEANFETFLENDSGFEAYAEGDRYDPSIVEMIRQKYEPLTPLQFHYSKIPKRNWNEEWEKSFSPIVVEERCVIRASFHQIETRYPIEIVITPKMSFGTGHHQTTYLMVKRMLSMNFGDKRVMDAGCGTGILAIVASRLGASEVQAFDIDEWSIENGNENTVVNNCVNIRIQQGKITEVDLTGEFDVILANINKNVLLEELGEYANFLVPGGYLLLSGFFTLDIPDLLAEASRHTLTEAGRDERETWASLLLQKSSNEAR